VSEADRVAAVAELVGFLRARLDEDEQRINEHPDGRDGDLSHIPSGLRAEEESNYPCLPFLRISKRPVVSADKTTAIREDAPRCHRWWYPHRWGPWQDGHATTMDDQQSAVQFRRCLDCNRLGVRSL
jgi:hypothetical protein